MAPPTKGQGSKRPRSEGIPEFMIVDTIPKNLWRWWTDMGSYEQRRVKEHLGHLLHLVEIDPRRDMIEPLIPFSDPKNNVFQFSNSEMTPTLAENASLIGKESSVLGTDLRSKKHIIPKNVDAKKFLDFLKINQIEKESLINGFVVETPPGFALNIEDILKILFGSIISELTEMVVEQDKGKVVYGYLSWFCDAVTSGDTPEGFSKKRKDQHTIRHLEKELEKANATIARQKFKSKEEEITSWTYKIWMGN
ncbi:hypothetical protein H5410_045596 [Solanum commersonii]|uniref:Uncharacterized protein n=1 Tax=Solanum commersonii TaxID=4109 RepID=A0A9J5XBL2_SOLCO|nr:hypothetical protein H5410_045596 [Solanum commersonii]